MNARMVGQRLWGLRRLVHVPRVLVSIALLGALLAGGALALGSLRPAQPTKLLPGQQLAWDLASSAAQTEGVQYASGAYLPGDRMVLYTRIAQPDRSEIRSWAQNQLQPFAKRFAALPGRETFMWMIDFGAEAGEQELLTVTFSRIAEPSFYRYISSSQSLSAQGRAPAADAAQVQPTAAPQVVQPADAAQVQPTAAPQAAQPADVAQAQPTAAPQVEEPGTPILSTTFDEQGTEKSLWLPLAGDWVSANGIYTQRNVDGYDFISMLDLEAQAHYQLDVKLRLGEGTMGGGFIYNAPVKTARAGAQIVDMDSQGSVLRWGRYDEKGAYIYQGSAKIDPPVSDGQWHSLRLVTHADTSVVSIDGVEIGTINNLSKSGFYGLTTSSNTVDFDSMDITRLEGPAADVQPEPTAAPAAELITSFADNFDDGSAQGWQVLGGTWQSIDKTYQQTDGNASDLGSSTAFQSDAYSMTVRLKRIDGDMGGGVYFNLAERNTKARSQMVNYTAGGKAIQWGHFDEGGNFVFEGQADVPDGNDGAWHVLNVQVKDGLATFALDGKEVAKDVKLTFTKGYIGLLVSHSKVAFDDFQVAAQ
jgi:hypothetical protein